MLVFVVKLIYRHSETRDTLGSAAGQLSTVNRKALYRDTHRNAGL